MLTNKIIELNQKEINKISGGLTFFAIFATLGAASSYHNIQQNSRCETWAEKSWSDESSCVTTLTIIDGLLLGTVATIAKFALTGKYRKAIILFGATLATAALTDSFYNLSQHTT